MSLLPKPLFLSRRSCGREDPRTARNPAPNHKHLRWTSSASSTNHIYRLQVYISDARIVVPRCVMKVALPGRESALYNEFAFATALPPHPHILRPYGAAKDDAAHTATHLAFPMCMGGDLHSYMQRFSEAQPIPCAHALAIFNQVIAGLSHIHLHGFVHRDLKPENIFFLDSACSVPLIADMGLAAQRGEMMHRLTGTVGYAPPESCLLGMHAAAARAGAPSLPSFDVWSLSIMGAELITGTDVQAIMYMLQTNQLEGMLSERVDTDLAKAICRGLVVSAADRITLQELQATALQALSLVQASHGQQPQPSPIVETIPSSVHAAPLAEPDVSLPMSLQQLPTHDSIASEDSTGSDASSSASGADFHPGPTASEHSIRLSMDSAPLAPVDAVTHVPSLPPLRIARMLDSVPSPSAQATPEVADDFAVSSALAPSAHSGAASPEWRAAAFAQRGSVPVLSDDLGALDLLHAASADCSSSGHGSERETNQSAAPEPQSLALPATLAPPEPQASLADVVLTPMPSLTSIRTSVPGAIVVPSASMGIEDGCTARSALALSPPPSSQASPRGSLLRRMRAFLKTPTFRRRGESRSLSPASAAVGVGSTGHKWGEFRSPRKVPNMNITGFLQSIHGRMRRGSSAAA